jgi:hypothetical protein
MKGWFFESELFHRVCSSEETRRDGSQQSSCRDLLLAECLNVWGVGFGERKLVERVSLLDVLKSMV